MLRATLSRIVPLSVKHLVLDGFFGTSSAAWVVRDSGLHLISKLRHNAALYLPYTGSKPRRGPTPRYGDKLDYRRLPSHACLQTVIEGQIVTQTYQFTVLHKEFVDPLNLLEDFMNVSQQAVSNAANLAFLMVNLSAALLQHYRQHQPDFSVLDLKTHFRARRYLDEAINSLPDPPAPDLISRLWQRFSTLGGIRPPAHLHDAA